jgi:hypothetical protein
MPMEKLRELMRVHRSRVKRLAEIDAQRTALDTEREVVQAEVIELRSLIDTHIDARVAGRDVEYIVIKGPPDVWGRD